MEPWQLTQDEYAALGFAAAMADPQCKLTGQELINHLWSEHKGGVAAAILLGRKIPAKVLKDYPDLQGVIRR